MARIVLTTAGTFLGGLVGVPMLGAAAGRALGNALLGPERSIDSGRREEFTVMGGDPGNIVARAWGTSRIERCNLIWAGEIREEEVKSGGKGSSTEYTEYHYYQSFAVGLCQGPIHGVRRIWFDGNLVANYAASLDTPEIRHDMEIVSYPGDELQEADPTIEGQLGAGQVPAFRGLAYLVFTEIRLDDWGHRLPNVSAEVVVEAPPEEMNLFAEPTELEYFGNGAAPLTQHHGGLCYHLSGSRVQVCDGRDGTRLFDPRTSFELWVGDRFAVGDGGDVLSAWSSFPYHYPARVEHATGVIERTPIGTALGIPYIDRFVHSPLLGEGGTTYLCTYMVPRLFTYQGHEMQEGPSFDLPSGYPEIIDICIDGRDGECLVLLKTEASDRWGLAKTDTAAGALAVLHEVTATDLGVQSRPFQMIWDEPRGAIWLRSRPWSSGNTAMRRLDPDTAQVNASWDLADAGTVSAHNEASFLAGIRGGHLYAVDQGRSMVVRYDTLGDVAEDFLAVGDLRIPGGEDYVAPSSLSNPILDEEAGALFFFVGETHYRLKLDSGLVGRGSTTLGDIVRDICLEAGIDETRLDVAELTQPVWGFATTEAGSARRILEALAAGLPFGKSEDAGMLAFRWLEDMVPAREIAGLEGLAAFDFDDEEPEAFLRRRGGEETVPRELRLHFINAQEDHRSDEVRSLWESAAGGIADVSLPLSLDVASADHLARSVHARLARSRISVETSLPGEQLDLAPGDVVSFGHGGEWYVVRVVEVEIGLPGPVLVRGRLLSGSHDGQAPAAATAATALPLDTAETFEDVPEPGRLRFWVMETPLTPGQPEGARVTVAVQAERDWGGAVIEASFDGGVEFERVEVARSQSVMGVTTAALAEGPPGVVDEGNALRVRLFRDDQTLVSVTAGQLAGYANLALVGSEVLQFRDASLEGGEWVLRGLVRGQFGTEGAIPGHAEGERFVLLGSTPPSRPVETALLGRRMTLRATPVGGSATRAVERVVTPEGISLRPYSPVHLQGERDGQGDLRLSWIRRTRIDGEADWRDGVGETPLGEEVASWRVEILDGETVVREALVSTQEYVYTAQDQADDFGGAQSAVAVRVGQLSARYGFGPQAKATL